MLSIIESELDCDCHPDCNTFKYTAETNGENAEERSNPKLLDIERVAADGSEGFNININWDIETPGYWTSSNFLADHNRDKFLFRYLLDWFKGKY